MIPYEMCVKSIYDLFKVYIMVEIENISSELRMKLEQIRMFLLQEKASVMVGAGFSKNAQQTEFAKMKDWNELTMSFYNQLFVGHEEHERNKGLLHEPLKLAQMYECSFGRNALDALIQNSLPNEAAAPGKLHEKLMQLKWHDVFTTNYDTLLERAAVKVGKIYHDVTNKETLLYAERPRIIKLHGSFPNIRPYIITEEDFRTYPQKYPEFVNTVRQALMESLFCLVGFSGNDPNFLQWIGWLRDVMGNQMSPVYLITYEPNLHKAQIDLFKRRGVEIVNIASLGKDVSYGEGLEFILDYISRGEAEEWSFQFSEKKLESVEDILEATEKMKIIRESCPPYLYLPEKCISAKNVSIPFRFGPDKNDIISKLTISQKINFVREVLWRYEIAMMPMVSPWIYGLMTDIVYGEYHVDPKDECSLVDIQLALLRMSRESGEDDKQFEELVVLIRDYELLPYQRHKLNYERCLQSLGLLDYDKVRQILAQWNVDGSEIKYALWKSMVLSEIGEDGFALRLLTIANQWFRQSLLTQNINQNVAETYSDALEEVINLHNRRNSPDNNLVRLRDSLIHAIDEAAKEYPDIFESRHEFGIDSMLSMWHSSSNLIDRLFPAYRYIRLQEEVGYPLGHSKFPIEEKRLEIAVSPIMGFRPAYAMRILVRSRSRKATMGCLTREALRKLPNEWADAQYEIYKDRIDAFLAANNRTAPEIKVENVLLPAFTRLVSKMEMRNAVHFAEQYIECFNKNLYVYDKAQFAVVLENLFCRSRSVINHRMFSTRNEEAHHDLPWSERWMNITEVNEKDVLSMVSALKNERLYEDDRILRRQWSMLLADLSIPQRNKIEDAVRQWRNKKHSKGMEYKILATYRKVKYKKHQDMRSEDDWLNIIINDIMSARTDRVVDSLQLRSLSANYQTFEYFVDKMTVLQHEQVISKFVDILTTNEKQLRIDDSDTFFGGFRGDVQILVVYFTKYIAHVDLSKIDASSLKQLSDVCKRYNDYGVAMIAILTKVNSATNYYSKEYIEEQIMTALLKGSYYEYSEGLQAIRFVEDESLRNKLIEHVLHYVEYCQSRKAQTYIYTLMSFIKDGIIDKSTWQLKIVELLIRLADAIEDFNGPEEERMDIMYAANMLAGVTYVCFGPNRGAERWKKISRDRENFNDVRAGFDIGQSMAYGEEKVPAKNLILNE